MNKYYITFGQKYRQELHPLFVIAHPDGYVTIEASDKELARAEAFRVFGPYWSMFYDSAEFDSSYYPKGELLHIVAPEN